MIRAGVILPWRGGDPERERAMEFVHRWWSRFGMPVEVVEHPGTDPFNRSWCVNEGARRLWPWDVLIVSDADVIEDTDEQVWELIRLVNETGRFGVGHTGAYDLNRAGTARVLNGVSVDWHRFVHQYRKVCNSRVNAVRADLFETVGGFDARFRGWGHEDGAFMRACVARGGPLVRTAGASWHLWHAPSLMRARFTPEYRENQRLAGRYLAAYVGDIDCTTAEDGPSEVRGWPAIETILNERSSEERFVAPVEGVGVSPIELPPAPPPPVVRTPTVDLVVFTAGRREYLERTLASAEAHLLGTIGRRVIVDDSGDAEFSDWLIARFPGYETRIHGANLGYTETMRDTWEWLSNTSGGDYVFHLEEDFTFDRDVNLRDLIAVVDRARPKVAQVVLLRHPFYEAELKAGGIIEEHPADYRKKQVMGVRYLEHRRFFSANPCLYRREIARIGWPRGESSEVLVGRQLTRRGMRFAYLGWNEPLVTHIGERSTREFAGATF